MKRGIMSPVKEPGYKSLYLTPVSRPVLWVLYGAVAAVACNLELCALTCLLTQAEIVMFEVCRDIKTKGRADGGHVDEGGTLQTGHSSTVVLHEATALY